MEQIIECFNEDIIDLLQSNKLQTFFKTQENNLAYIDLPYGGESSDYLKLYSFLEEYIALKPISELTYLQKANDRFSSKNSYQKNFDLFLKLLFNLDLFKIWVFSFNESSFKSIESIKKDLLFYSEKIVVKFKDYQYQYRKDKDTGKEYLIICWIKNKKDVDTEIKKKEDWLQS